MSEAGISEDPVQNADEDDDVMPTKLTGTPAASSAHMPLDRNNPHYNMDHEYRSIALIFYHKNFKEDCKKLKKCLYGLGFYPLTFPDCTAQTIKDIIEKARDENHAQRACVLVAVLSNGEDGSICASDETYRVEKLWLPFAANKCHYLAGKPKIFIIQACQEGKSYSKLMTQTDSGGSGSHTYRIPIMADFLISYSCMPASIQALCDELREKGYNYDLLTIFVYVNLQVASAYESNTPDNPGMHRHKQVPCLTYTLTRLVKFIQKDYPDVEEELQKLEDKVLGKICDVDSDAQNRDFHQYVHDSLQALGPSLRRKAKQGIEKVLAEVEEENRISQIKQ